MSLFDNWTKLDFEKAMSQDITIRSLHLEKMFKNIEIHESAQVRKGDGSGVHGDTPQTVAKKTVNTLETSVVENIYLLGNCTVYANLRERPTPAQLGKQYSTSADVVYNILSERSYQCSTRKYWHMNLYRNVKVKRGQGGIFSLSQSDGPAVTNTHGDGGDSSPAPLEDPVAKRARQEAAEKD